MSLLIILEVEDEVHQLHGQGFQLGNRGGKVLQFGVLGGHLIREEPVHTAIPVFQFEM